MCVCLSVCLSVGHTLETTLPEGLETLVEGHIANIGISLDVFEFSHFH